MTKQKITSVNSNRLCKDIGSRNNTVIQAATDEENLIAVKSFALKTIISALNSPDDAILRTQALSDHKFMHDSYNRAVEKREKLLAENLTTLEQMDPEQRKVAEDGLRQIVVLPHIQEYVEDAMCSILTSTYNVNVQKAVQCVIVSKKLVTPDKVKDYYKAYSEIEKILRMAKENERAMSIAKAIEQFNDIDDKSITVSPEMVKKAHFAIKTAVNFYAPRYMQLFGKDLFKGLEQPEQAIDPDNAHHTSVISDLKNITEEPLFLRKILWISLPNRRQKIRDR